MIARPYYMQTLRKYRNTPLVKILSGIRRCGKSTLLEILKADLLETGVDQSHIIMLRYTSETFEENMTHKQMYASICAQMRNEHQVEINNRNSTNSAANTYYLLLDEVQEVEGWEKAVNSLLENHPTDIYVTGSNSKLMSSEISTYLTGRYVSIPVYTLSFSEFYNYKTHQNTNAVTPSQLLNEYIRKGGFPVVAAGNFDEDSAYQIVEGIYASVVTADIARRNKVANLDLFNRVMRYVVENVGKTFSANSIAKFLKSEGRSLSVETVYNYLEWLEKAFVIYRCQRYDVQGKAVLKTQEKFYLADSALKYSMFGFSGTSVASMIENIVYFELLRKGYKVYVGKFGTKEIDFVAQHREKRMYVQVCRQMPEASDREIANLLAIKDQYPKYVVTLDEYASDNVEGVRIISLADFLLHEQQ